VNALQLKSMLVGSPFEGLAKNAQWLMGVRHRIKHPEMWEIYQEERLLPLILERLLTRSSNVLDVGSHIGSFLSLASAIAIDGKHVAIDASPTKASRLVSKFSKARIEAVAISDHVGTAMFEENLKNPGFSKLADGHDDDDPVKSYEVPLTTLDALGLGKIDLMKIDVEGAELVAFKGGRAFIESNRPKIIFECGTAYKAGLDRFALYDYLTEEMSYQIFLFTDFLYDKGPLGRDEFRKCGIYPFRAFNFVALPSTDVA
jgi:FkbM family methyltransferase